MEVTGAGKRQTILDFAPWMEEPQHLECFLREAEDPACRSDRIEKVAKLVEISASLGDKRQVVTYCPRPCGKDRRGEEEPLEIVTAPI
jgi:hypothetical protein